MGRTIELALGGVFDGSTVDLDDGFRGRSIYLPALGLVRRSTPKLLRKAFPGYVPGKNNVHAVYVERKPDSRCWDFAGLALAPVGYSGVETGE